MREYYVRVESWLHYYAFYTVKAANESDAGIYARRQFAEDFGGTFEKCRASYVWDLQKCIKLPRGMTVKQHNIYLD